MYYLGKRKPKKKKTDDDLPIFKAAGIKTPRVKDYKGQLDKIFSKYIRMRDAMPNGYCKCICCGRILPIKDFDAGHYFSRRHTATRWNENNVHAECKYDNRFNAEHLDFFREHLIQKIGENEYKKLLVLSHSTMSYTDTELQELIKHYKEEVKRLEKEKGIKI